MDMWLGGMKRAFEEGNDASSEWTTKARTAKADLKETSRREFEEDWVESGGGYRSGEMERGRLLRV